MYTTSIPNDQTEKTERFTRIRAGQSDYQLLIELLDIVSNRVLLTDILTIKPTYVDFGLVLVVTYLSY